MAKAVDYRGIPSTHAHLYYPGEPVVLVNKLDIRDAAELRRQELAALDLAYTRLHLREYEFKKHLTVESLLKLHGLMLGHIYDWAGRCRRLDLSAWCPPEFLEQHLQKVETEHFKKFPLGALQTDEQFCLAAAEIHGEFIAAHPFWDGNGRTIRLAIDAMAVQTGRPPLLYPLGERATENRQRYLAASSFAFNKQDYAPLAELFGEALQNARLNQLAQRETDDQDVHKRSRDAAISLKKMVEKRRGSEAAPEVPEPTEDRRTPRRHR